MRFRQQSRPLFMTRLSFTLLVLPVAASVAQGAEKQVIASQRYHLGTPGLPEWQEFERSTPHGRQLELTFSASAGPGEATLLIRQRNVKTAWSVTLNGQKLGTLESLTQPLVRALSVPAGVLKPAGNRLLIARAQETGFKRVWLSVEPSNIPAIRSYSNAGFQVLRNSLWAPEIEMEVRF